LLSALASPERLPEQAPQGIADDLAAARGEQVFSPGIEIANGEFVVHQHHGR
jgi:hypothetical protein